MQNNLNKKALNSIVTTLLLAGISIAAVAILIPMINNIVKSPMLSPGIQCNEINSQQILKIEDVCYNDEKEIRVKITRSIHNINIPSITFSLNNNQKLEKWICCSDECNNCNILNAGETKIYYLTSNEPIKDATISILTENCFIQKKEIKKCGEL